MSTKAPRGLLHRAIYLHRKVRGSNSSVQDASESTKGFPKGSGFKVKDSGVAGQGLGLSGPCRS